MFRLSEGPPAYTFNVAPDGSVPFVGTNYSGRNASWYDPNMRLPYIATWSGGIQYQLTNSIVVEGRYQGSAGVGLLNNWNINVLPLDVAANDPARQQQIFQNYQNFRPYPQFNTINHYSNYGHNTYHGGTWRVEKRYSAGITFNVFYTYSKTINDADDDGEARGVTYYNRRLEKARASYDIQHRAVSIFTWDLPFGKGRRWMSGGGWKDWFFGGWDGAWTQTYQSGPPVSVTFAGSPEQLLPEWRVAAEPDCAGCCGSAERLGDRAEPLPNQRSEPVLQFRRVRLSGGVYSWYARAEYVRGSGTAVDAGIAFQGISDQRAGTVRDSLGCE